MRQGCGRAKGIQPSHGYTIVFYRVNFPRVIFIQHTIIITDFVVFTQLPAVYSIVQESVPITSPGSRVRSYLDGLSVKIDIFYSIETYKIWMSMTVFAWLFFRFDLWIKFIKTLLNRKLLCKSTNVKLFIIFFLTYIRHRMTSTKRL